jgi:NAD(P)H-dependent FMN reductase
MSNLRIGIVVGSTRPGRVAPQVAEWVRENASAHAADVEFEIVDLADFPLPHYDEPESPIRGTYRHDHTIEWAREIARYDGFIFVTPEYNHSITGPLKNAIDYIYREWNDKAAAIVSYGYGGGLRAAEQLRLILGEVQIADVRQQVGLFMAHDFEDHQPKPGPVAHAQLKALVDQVVAWSGALRTVREAKGALVAA